MPQISELLKNTAVRVALAVVAVIAVGSITYYLIESAPPSVAYATVQKGNIVDDVTSTGTVAPVQNPTLSFESSGQVTSVNVKAGDTVQAGSVLATLDTGILSASLEGAQAKLDELEAGPRSTDVAGKQTDVQTAQQTLNNTYTNFPQMLQSTEAKAEEAVYSTDILFDNSRRSDPALLFNTNTDLNKINVDVDRAELTTMFSEWETEVASANTSSPSQMQTLSENSLAHLNQVRSFLSDLVTALNDAQITGTLTQADDTQDITLANTARDTVNGLISSLTASTQSISTNQLALQSAQDTLNQTLAGSASQDVAAQQAVVAGIAAQLRQQEIIAPFSGKVASVSIKAGDVASPSTAAIALIPNGNFEVDVYLPENQMTALKVGDPADVTLDAYGASRIFPASVATIETSPSIDPNSAGGTSGGYKVTLVFNQADSAIANGMHANVTVHAGNAQNVLIIPKSAVITDGTSQFALKQTANGLVRTPITLGLTGSSTVEVQSGLSVGDKISAVGAQ